MLSELSRSHGACPVECHCAIERIDIDKRNIRLRIFCEVYKDQASKAAGANPIPGLRIVVPLTKVADYQTYFNQAQNIFTCAYNYVNQYEITIDPTEPGGEPTTELIMKDWDSV